MYKQLSHNQRRQIEQLHRKGVSQSAIARTIGVHRSTVKRELERNSVEGEYKADHAQKVRLLRKQRAGYLSQQDHFEKPADFKYKLSQALRLKKDEKQLTTRRKDKPKRYQYRSKRYQPYVPRKDERNYKLHANKRRSKYYHLWKSNWESRYRFRDNAKAELNRMMRTAQDFRRYWKSEPSSELGRFLEMKRILRQQARERYEQKCIEFESFWSRHEQEMLEIRLKWAEEEEIKQAEEAAEEAEIPVINIEREEPHGAFVFFFFAQALPVLLQGPNQDLQDFRINRIRRDSG
jgi:hypothetical protein